MPVSIGARLTGIAGDSGSASGEPLIPAAAIPTNCAMPSWLRGRKAALRLDRFVADFSRQGNALRRRTPLASPTTKQDCRDSATAFSERKQHVAGYRHCLSLYHYSTVVIILHKHT